MDNYLNIITSPLFFFHGLPQTKITKVDFDNTPKPYKTLIPFKKKKRGGKKELLMWLIKDGHRNKLKLKGREKQKDKWWFGILKIPF